MKNIKVNEKKLLKDAGMEVKNIKTLILYMQDEINFLYTHNKNYNNEQYTKIQILQDIIKCFEID